MKQVFIFDQGDVKEALADFADVEVQHCDLDIKNGEFRLNYSQDGKPKRKARKAKAPSEPQPEAPPAKKQKIGDNPRLYNYKGTELTVYHPQGPADTRPPRAGNEAAADLARAGKKNPHMTIFELAENVLGWKRV